MKEFAFTTTTLPCIRSFSFFFSSKQVLVSLELIGLHKFVYVPKLGQFVMAPSTELCRVGRIETTSLYGRKVCLFDLNKRKSIILVPVSGNTLVHDFMLSGFLSTRQISSAPSSIDGAVCSALKT